MPKALVVEDDQSIAEPVAYTLRHEGLDVSVAYDGPSGVREAEAETPDLVVLDLMPPGLDGFGVLRSLRKSSKIPVIMLTAKASESDRVPGIELGADDYVTKPFSMRELVARVRMVLRRLQASSEDEPEVVSAGDIVVDRARREVTVAGEPRHLTPQEFALLECLVRNAGRALTREIILGRAWHESEYIDSRTVDVHVRWLREKIEEAPSAFPLTAARDASRGLRQAVGVAAVGVAVLAGLVGLFVASGITRPLGRLAETVRRIGAGAAGGPCPCRHAG